MSEQDHDGDWEGAVDALIDRAAEPEPPPPEARDRVWERVSETVGLEGPPPDGEGAADSGDSGGDGSASGGEAGGDGATGVDGGTSAGAEGASVAEAADVASGVSQAGGWSSLLPGAGVVQTALAFTLGAGVGAGGYAVLDSVPDSQGSDDARQSHAVVESTDVGHADTSVSETGVPDTGLEDAARADARQADTGADVGANAGPETGLADVGVKTRAPAPSPPVRDDRHDGDAPPPDSESSEEASRDAGPTDNADQKGHAGQKDEAGPKDEASPDVSALEDERLLLSRARSALQRGHHKQALDALRKHASSFADGQLAEERRALEVRALLGLGRHKEARQRAEAFMDAYPNSIFRGIVQPALDR